MLRTLLISLALVALAVALAIGGGRSMSDGGMRFGEGPTGISDGGIRIGGEIPDSPLGLLTAAR